MRTPTTPTLDDYETAGDPRITPVDIDGPILDVGYFFEGKRVRLLDEWGHIHVPDPTDDRGDQYITESRDGWIIRGAHGPDGDVKDPDGGDHAFINFEDPGDALHFLLGDPFEMVDFCGGVRVIIPEYDTDDEADDRDRWRGDFYVNANDGCFYGGYEHEDGWVEGGSVEAILAFVFRGEDRPSIKVAGR